MTALWHDAAGIVVRIVLHYTLWVLLFLPRCSGWGSVLGYMMLHVQVHCHLKLHLLFRSLDRRPQCPV